MDLLASQNLETTAKNLLDVSMGLAQMLVVIVQYVQRYVRYSELIFIIISLVGIGLPIISTIVSFA